jgi:Tol biopolymer transport system component
LSKLALFRAICLAGFLALITAYVSEAASPIRQLTVTTSSNVRPALSPDGKRIAFQSNRDGPYHIYVMDANGANVTQLTSGHGDERHPAWSPDGKFIVFDAVDTADTGKREIWTIEVSSKRRTQVTKIGAIASFPSWSPDGKTIAFYLYRAGAMDLWTVKLDGAAPSPLTRGLASEANSQCTFACHGAAWAPDGSRLAVTDGDGTRVLLLSATSGSASAPVSPSDERSHFPIFLPDGRLVYVSEHVTIDQSWTDLWLVDPNSTAPRSQLAGNVQVQGPFEFTSDARELLFASPRSGNFEIYAVTLDADGKAALATKPSRLSAGELPRSRSAEPANGFQLPRDPEPYLLAVGILAFLAVGVETIVRRRRRNSPTA